MPSLQKRITATSKFRIGDRVRILPQGQKIFVGVEGVVHDVHSNDRGIAVLDQYDVLFTWGEKKSFYEVQLELTAE